ncbi:MAG: restriction endonuclease subunit S [Scytolyngbya sp. HA4215-MV1]|nr:restriction endonuclease subunit S [Scytolyngbya sp. HA4215-MV1]
MTKAIATKQEKAEKPLPKGWKQCKLGNVCDIVARQVDPKLPQYGALPHVNGENIEGGTCRLLYLRTAAEEGMTSGKYLFESGNVLYSKLRPYLRKAIYVDFRGVCSADMYPLTVNSEVLDPHFLTWLLISDEFTSYADAQSRRARMPKLNREQLFDWDVLLPPLSEQQQIVTILNQQMAAVEQARAATLTQLAAAKALPAAYLRQVFDSPEAQTWKRKKLGDIALVSGGIQKTPNRSPHSFHRPYLTVRNVQRGWLDLSVIERFEITDLELERCRLECGDLLIVEGNGSIDQIGRNAIYRGELGECIHQNHLIRVRLDQTKENPDFLSLYLNSELGKIQMIQKAMTTTGLHTLSVSKVQQLAIPVVSLEKQNRIISHIKEKLTVATSLAKSLEDQLDEIAQLPTAILRQAFNGEL